MRKCEENQTDNKPNKIEKKKKIYFSFVFLVNINLNLRFIKLIGLIEWLVYLKLTKSNRLLLVWTIA